MLQTIRLFLLFEGASFAVAALFHAGLLIAGYAHRQAAIAESTIAVVLLAGLALTWAWPVRARAIGLAVQGFALLGTLVGLYTVSIGIGPQTVPDIVYHIAILVVLVAGLVVTARATTADLRSPA